MWNDTTATVLYLLPRRMMHGQQHSQQKPVHWSKEQRANFEIPVKLNVRQMIVDIVCWVPTLERTKTWSFFSFEDDLVIYLSLYLSTGIEAGSERVLVHLLRMMMAGWVPKVPHQLDKPSRLTNLQIIESPMGAAVSAYYVPNVHMCICDDRWHVIN